MLHLQEQQRSRLLRLLLRLLVYDKIVPYVSLPLPPALSDFDSLDERDQEKNNQLGFDVAEREFGISPCMTGKEMSSVVEPDKLSMVMYLSQFYEMFKDTVPPGGESG